MENFKETQQIFSAKPDQSFADNAIKGTEQQGGTAHPSGAVEYAYIRREPPRLTEFERFHHTSTHPRALNRLKSHSSQ